MNSSKRPKEINNLDRIPKGKRQVQPIQLPIRPEKTPGSSRSHTQLLPHTSFNYQSSPSSSSSPSILCLAFPFPFSIFFYLSSFSCGNMVSPRCVSSIINTRQYLNRLQIAPTASKIPSRLLFLLCTFQEQRQIRPRDLQVFFTLLADG